MKFYKETTITRGDNQPYLIRYSLFSCRFFAIKIHHILISDDDCPHNHPWAFVTILLKGHYLEHRVIDKVENIGYKRFTHKLKIAKRYSAGNILYRPANSIHRLVLDEGKTVRTLVITFKKVQDWGFFTPRGFVGWRDYVQNREGRCE